MNVLFVSCIIQRPIRSYVARLLFALNVICKFRIHLVVEIGDWEVLIVAPLLVPSVMNLGWKSCLRTRWQKIKSKIEIQKNKILLKLKLELTKLIPHLIPTTHPPMISLLLLILILLIPWKVIPLDLISTKPYVNVRALSPLIMMFLSTHLHNDKNWRHKLVYKTCHIHSFKNYIDRKKTHVLSMRLNMSIGFERD